MIKMHVYCNLELSTFVLYSNEKFSAIKDSSTMLYNMVLYIHTYTKLKKKRNNKNIHHITYNVQETCPRLIVSEEIIFSQYYLCFFITLSHF